MQSEAIAKRRNERLSSINIGEALRNVRNMVIDVVFVVVLHQLAVVGLEGPP